MAETNQGVYHRSIQSGTWYLLNIFAQKAINFVNFFILARLLNPRDYGVIGVVLLIQGLFDQFTNPSFGQALTRSKDSIEEYLDPSWTFDLMRYVAISIIIFFTAGFIGSFFHFGATEITLLKWSGAFLIACALGNVRQVYFFKDLRFDKIFLRDVVVQISFAVAAASYALLVQPSVWALFVGYLVSYLVSTAVSYILYPSRPAFVLRFGRLRELVDYSKWVYGQTLLETILAQIDKLMVGRLLDPSSLGVYAKGKDLASTTTAIMSSIISKVGFSAFAMVQDQMDKVRRGFLQSIDVLLLSGLPATLLLLLEGGSIVSLLLGGKWLAIVVPLKIFAFGNMFIAFVRLVNPVLAALGRPDVNFKTDAIQMVISIPCMYFGYLFYGMNGLAAAVVATWIFLLIYVMLKARPVLNIAVKEFVPGIVSAGSAGLLVLAVDFVGRSFVHAKSTATLTIAWIAILGLLYFACIYVVGQKFSNSPWRTLVSIFNSLLHRKSPALPK